MNNKGPITLRTLRFPGLGTCRPDEVSAQLGTGFVRFKRSDGVSGLAKPRRKLVEILAVDSTNPGQGFFKRFIKDLKRVYPRIAIYHVWSELLKDKLPQYGFTRMIECKDGEITPGFVWDRDGIDVNTETYVIETGSGWLCDPSVPSFTGNIAEAFFATTENIKGIMGFLSENWVPNAFEIGNIGTTILLKHYIHGREQDQATTQPEG